MMHGEIRSEKSVCRDSVFRRLRPLWVTVILLGLSLQACTIENLKTEHVVMVNGMGDLIDPRGNIGDPENGKHLLFVPYDKLQSPDKYFEHLIASLGTVKTREGRERKRILLFVHGGLNTAQASIGRAADYSDLIAQDGTYPIFINWDSSLTSS